MKNVVTTLVLAASIVGMTSCGGGYSDEAKAVADGICECAKDDQSIGNIKSCLMSEMMKSDKVQEFATSDDPRAAGEAFGKEIQYALKDHCTDIYDVLKENDK